MIDDLWQQVRSNPHDAGYYAVLADALIEAGDPQGELMSVQLDIESSKRHELFALRARERELIDQLRERLLGGLPRGEYKIMRGVVAAAQLGHGWEQEPELLAKRTLLDEAWLRMNVQPIVARAHPALLAARTLIFGIPKQVRAMSLELPQLEDLRFMAAPNEICELVAANPKVTRVVLTRCRLADYESLAKMLRQLVSLKLRNWITPHIMRPLVAGPIDKLEVLRLPGHEAGTFLPALFERSLPELRELDLRGDDSQGATLTADPMTNQHLEMLARSQLRPKKLAIGACAINTLAPLLGSPLAAELEELVIEKMEHPEISVLRHFPRLTRLTLQSCALFSEQAALELADERWTSLDLTGTWVPQEVKQRLEDVLGGDVTFETKRDWIETNPRPI